MSVALPINASHGGPSSNIGILKEETNFSLNACVKHIAHKAGFKQQGRCGRLVKWGLGTQLKTRVMGDNANARYHRARYESSQRCSSAIWAEARRAQLAGNTLDENSLAESELLQSRFTRQDNVRFNPELMNEKTHGLSTRHRWGVRLARWAHYLNGMTEMAAAPTGMLLKSSKIAVTPNRDDRSGWGQVRIMAALVAVAGAVSGFSVVVFDTSIGQVSKKVASAIAKDVKSFVAGYSAVVAVTAIASLVLAAASNACLSRSKLSPKVIDMLGKNEEKHTNRLHALLDAFKDTPGAVTLLSKALQPKIGKAYRAPDNDGQPVLLKRLLDDVRSSNGNADLAKQAIRTTLGSYMVEKDINGGGGSLCSKPDSAELLRRENHVIGLTNLIEHCRIHDEPDPGYKDLRHQFEDAVKSAREKVLGSTANALKAVGLQKQSEKVAHMKTEEYINAREGRKKAPDHARKMCFHTDYMTENRHQFGPVTRALLKTSEILRVFNHGVVLSLNYQLTRPITWIAGRVREWLLNSPDSRTVSFSIGRAFAGSIWASIDAALILSLAAGRGIGFTGGEAAKDAKTLPWKIPVGKGGELGIGATSTAAQMVLISGFSFGFLMLASAVARLEGWKGDVSHPVDKPGSKRESLDIGNLLLK